MRTDSLPPYSATDPKRNQLRHVIIMVIVVIIVMVIKVKIVTIVVISKVAIIDSDDSRSRDLILLSQRIGLWTPPSSCKACKAPGGLFDPQAPSLIAEWLLSAVPRCVQPETAGLTNNPHHCN